MKEAILWIHSNGKSRQIEPGFCWFGFFLPHLWAFSEGLWRLWAGSLWAIFLVALSITASKNYALPFLSLIGLGGYLLLMIAFGVLGKKWLVADMLKQGYQAKNLPVRNASQALTESANTSMGISIALLFLGPFFLQDGMAVIGIVALFASLVLFIWGCAQYATAKGYSPWLGGLGLLLVFGLMVISWLPDKQNNHNE